MPQLGLKLSASLQGRLRLARLLDLPEEEVARLARKLEAEPLFGKLIEAGAVRVTPFPQAFFATRRFFGLSLAARDTGLAELLDGDSEFVRLMRKIGRRSFEENFLRGERLSDAQRGHACGITAAEARRLREFLDRMYIRAEFEGPPPAAAAKAYSTVAGIAFERGKLFLRFFNREIWKGRYAVDAGNLAAFLAGLGAQERERARRCLSRLEFVDLRKTTLFKVLEALLQAQAAFFKTGDPGRLAPLTQRELAAAVDAEPSVLNRLISNKAVELPWGTEAPLRGLFPSAKLLARKTVRDFARANPKLSDEELRRELALRHRIELSRRSVAQYRKELGLGARGKR